MNMINIVLYGINLLSIKILNLIDRNKCNIIAIATNSQKNIGKKIDNISIVGLEDINNLSYELMITTIYNKVFDNNIYTINFKEYLTNYYDFEISSFLYKLSNNNENIDGFITGLSYVDVGIDVSRIDGNVINAAISSQDIFYDYEMAKYILSDKTYSKNIKFALIGLTYYSFEFDLSKCSVKDRVYFYYPFIKNIHNKNDFSEKKCERFDQLDEILKRIFIKDYKNEIYKDIENKYEKGWQEYISGHLTNEKIIMGRKDVEKDSLKNYPETVKENITVLNNYITFLKNNNIKPYIVVAPVSKYYYLNLSERIKNEFKSIMIEISNKNSVKIYDYFNSSLFNDEDFYDIAHLNRKGAIKFTELINSDILSQLK